MKRHLAIWTAALVIPGGVFLLIVYYYRTKPWFKEDRQ